jgi:hypothetical protein
MKQLNAITIILLGITIFVECMEAPSFQATNSDDARRDWNSWWQNPDRENRALEQETILEFREYILDATAEKTIKPHMNPATPSWPVVGEIDYKDPEKEQKLKFKKLAAPHRHTVEKLAYGPCRGMKARIERSGWALWGVDTLDTSTADHVCGVNLPMMCNYYFDTPALHIDQYVPLYFGHLLHENGYIEARVIPSSWLSLDDRINLFNFYQWELEVLGSKYGARIFDPQSPARAMLRTKINNELDNGQTTLMIHFLFAHRFRLLQNPECVEEFYGCIQLNKEIAIAREKADPSNIWSDSYFLHALFLEALKHQDVEILTNRRILYNSLWVLDQIPFKKLKKNEGDLDDKAVHAEIAKWMPMAEMMREHEYVDEYNMLYTDLLPRTLRSTVLAIMLCKTPQQEIKAVETPA